MWTMPCLLLLCWFVRSGATPWAVLVCASREWRNYRHVANALSLYRTVKRLGLPDSHIILMLGEDVACNARNAFPAAVFNEQRHAVDLYGDRMEVDYRGKDVTAENFVRVLTGRHEAALPRSKRLLSDQDSRILIYLTGHGGEEFLRFQSQHDMLAKDLADALAQMHAKRRYREILLMIDTCEAATLFTHINAPNVFTVGSSIKGESSYAYVTDPLVGVSLIDRFTLATLRFFEQHPTSSGMQNATLEHLLQSYRPDQMLSTLYYNSASSARSLASISLRDFFSHVSTAHPIHQVMKLRKY